MKIFILSFISLTFASAFASAKEAESMLCLDSYHVKKLEVTEDKKNSDVGYLNIYDDAGKKILKLNITLMEQDPSAMQVKGAIIEIYAIEKNKGNSARLSIMGKPDPKLGTYKGEQKMITSARLKYMLTASKEVNEKLTCYVSPNFSM